MARRIKDTLRYAVPPLALIFLVLGAIFFGIATPTEAAGVGAFAAVHHGHRLREAHLAEFCRLPLPDLPDRHHGDHHHRRGHLLHRRLPGARGAAPPWSTRSWAWASGNGAPTAMIMIIYIILGCFIDWIGIVMITFPIFLPVAQQLGFDMLWFVAMLAINLQMSFLTPPFGYALFYLSGLGIEGVKLGHIYRGVVPFLILQAIGVTICTYSQIVVWLPNVMLGK